MPNQYQTRNDDKLHTRYSELVNIVSDAGLQRVLDQRFGLKKKLELEAFDFGRGRHEMLEEEGRATNRVPEYFGVGHIPISHAEQQFAVEPFPGVVIHFTPDLLAESIALIGDYKMSREPAAGWSIMPTDGLKPRPSAYTLYKSSVQLDFYAWLLSIVGIKIKEKMYMVEYWNNDRTRILGHDFMRQPVGLKEKGAARAWGIDRIKQLMAGRQIYLDAGYREDHA